MKTDTERIRKPSKVVNGGLKDRQGKPRLNRRLSGIANKQLWWLDDYPMSYEMAPLKVSAYFQYYFIFALNIVAFLILIPLTAPIFLQKFLWWALFSKNGMQRNMWKKKGAKEVVIVGAGPSGVVCHKETKGKGHNIVAHFEGAGMVGGSFSRISYTGWLTSSNLMTRFSSFDYHKCVRDPYKLRYLSFNDYVEYLGAFCDYFGLNITYNTMVTDTKFNKKTKRWTVTAKNSLTGKVTTVTCDTLVIATGSFGTVNSIRVDESKFKGKVIPTWEFDGPEDVEGKRVCVVGLGEAGSDLVYQSSCLSESCHLVTRSGPGVMIPRYQRGVVNDLDTSTLLHCTNKADSFLKGFFPLYFKVFKMLKSMNNTDYDDKMFGAWFNMKCTKWQFIERYGTKSSGFVQAIARNGAIYHETTIKSLEGNTVTCNNGDKFEADVIINCTGFKPNFDYLPSDVTQFFKEKTVRGMFARMFMPQYGENLCFIGFARPAIGTIPVIAELQSRYFAQILSGKPLPSREEQTKAVKFWRDYEFSQYGEQCASSKAVLVDYSPFLTNMARLIGADVNWWKLFFTDIRLWWVLLTRPIHAIKFRFFGPDNDYEGSRYRYMALPDLPLSGHLVLINALLVLQFTSFFGISSPMYL